MHRKHVIVKWKCVGVVYSMHANLCSCENSWTFVSFLM